MCKAEYPLCVQIIGDVLQFGTKKRAPDEVAMPERVLVVNRWIWAIPVEISHTS